MAGQRLTDKSAITDNLATDDKLMVVDTSDTTGSAAGTSKKIDNKFIIQTTKTSVASGIFQAMDTSGGAGTFGTLLGTPGSGFFYQVLGITVVVDYASGTQTAKVNLLFGWDTTSTTVAFADIRSFMQGETADKNFSVTGDNQLSAGGGSAGIDNRSFYVWADANFTSTFSADFYITYQVVKL